MIPKIQQRKLSWYFESVWLPAHRDEMHGSMVGMVRKTVADFVKFAECDPRIGEITASTLDEFESCSRLQKFRRTIAVARRRRIEAIVHHAIPPKSVKQAVTEPAECSLRHYARVVLTTVNPELRPKTIGDYSYVVNVFCRWYGEDIATADVTPGLIEQFEEGGGKRTQNHAWRLRALMRTYDPMLFHVRCGRKPPAQPDRGNGSEFLLTNLYANRYERIALRARSIHTKRLYRTTLVTFDRFLERPATIDDLSDDTVSGFAAWRVSQGLSKHTVNKDLFNLLALWRWCHRKHLVEKWPDVEMENAPRRTPVAWTEDEMHRLYDACCSLPGSVGKHLAHAWWPALISVAWDSGERISAIMGLTWDRVDLDTRWVSFRAEHRKGGREDSAVHLSKDSITAIKKIRGDGEGPVFPWPYSRTYLWYQLSRILKVAGLSTDAKSKFHRIRKSVASHAEAAGGNATVMLRHSKREITDAYIDPRIVKRQQPADVLFRLAK
jgi:integrase